MSDLGTRLARLRGTTASDVISTDIADSKSSASSIGIAERVHRLRPGGARTDTATRVSDAELATILGGTLVAEGLVEFCETIETDTREPVDVGGFCNFLGIGASRAPAFLDTETTGLSGGTGTVAFLVGIATIREGNLQVRQWLMSRFGAEAALLERVGSVCMQSDMLVTYNGKSFDAPLLSARYRIHRSPDPLAGLAHLDVLHPIRRLWGSRWPNCRLATAETRLLGVIRQGDLPGAEAPESWFSWLHKGELDRLGGVVRHNRQDLLSLARLPGAVTRAMRCPRPGEIDLAALAREHDRRGELAAARRLLHDHESALDHAALLYFARLLKRERRWPDAVRLWGRLAGLGIAEAMAELAKFHEHGSRDLCSALEWTRSLIGVEGHLPHHRHRECRLLKKLAAGRTKSIESGIIS